MRARIIGLALAVTPGLGWYIPLSAGATGELDLAKPDMPRLDEQTTLARLSPVFQDDAVLKIAHNIKFLHVLLGKRGIRIRGIDDPMLMSYVLDLGKSAHGLEELSELHLQHKPVALSDLVGKGRDRIPLETVALPQATRFAAERADVALRLNMLLKPRLIAERRMTVYETLERPLIPVLAEMELAGITIAPAALAKLSNDFAHEMERLEQECCALAGEPFNLGSPKQLGDILFGKFSLPGGRRTRTDPADPDSVDRPLLSFLSQNAVCREMRRNPNPFPQAGKPSTLRNRWRHQSDFIADLLRFGLWAWHYPAPREAELTEVADDILHGPDPLTAIHRLCYRDLRRHLDTPTFRLSLIAAAEAEGDAIVREAIAERNQQNGALWREFYEKFLQARGLKLRPGVTIDEVVLLLSAIADGLALRALADPDGVIDHQQHRSLLSLAAFSVIASCAVPAGDRDAPSLEDHINELMHHHGVEP